MAKKVEAEVEFKSKGLSKLKGQWLDFAGDLAEPVILLSAGASKAQAAWAGLRGVFMTRVLGPMGLVAGATVGLIALSGKLIAKWKEMGVEGAKAMESMELEFKPLLGSMELAKKRVEELYKFTAETPFRLKEVAAANKLLQSLTQGALSSREGMLLVSDAAAVANSGIDVTARSVGRLYDGLMSGRPVGEASMRLQEMGLITGKTRNAIESMQAANDSGSAIWAVVERDLQRNKGAADDLSKSLGGLESTYEDVSSQLSAGFGKGFLEGEKAALSSQIKVLEAFGPVAEFVGEKVGRMSNAWKGFKSDLVASVASVPGATSVLKGLAIAFGVLSTAILMASGIALGRFLLGVVAVTRASKAQITVMGADTAIKTVNTVVTSNLAKANGFLSSALYQARLGSYLAAAGHLKQAAGATIASFRVNALATSTKLLSGVFKALVWVTKFVVTQLKDMAVALVTNKFFLIAGAVAGLIAVWDHFNTKAKKAEKALKDYKKAVDDLTHSLKMQRNSIETLADLRKHEADVIRALAEAHREEAKARREGDADMLAAAQKKVSLLEKDLEVTNSITNANLRRTEAEAARENRDYTDKEKIEDSEFDSKLNDGLGEEKVKLLEEKARKVRADYDKARADEAEELRVGQSKGDSNKDGLMAKELLADKNAELLDYEDKNSRYDNDNFDESKLTKQGRGKYEKYLEGKKKLLEEIAVLNLEVGVGGDSAEGLASSSEIVVLKTKLALHKNLEAAISAEEELKRKVAELSGADDVDDKKLKIAERELATQKAIVVELDKMRAASGGDVDSRNVEDLENKLKRLEAKRDKDGSSLNVHNADEAAKKAREEYEYEVSLKRLEVNSEINKYALSGYEAAQKELDIEREKLTLRMAMEKISAKEYEMALEVLRAKGEKIKSDVKERGDAVKGNFEANRFDRQAEDARRNGDQGKADELEAKAVEIRAKMREKALRKEAEALTSNEQQIQKYIDAVMKEEAAVREGSKSRKDAEDARDREKTRLSGEGGLGVELLRKQGKTREADALEESQARKADAIKRKELQEKYRTDGFSGEEADNLANRDVKVGQAQRLIAKMKEESSPRVVANSLAKIGGGGAVVGRDREEKLLERIEGVLKEIRDKDAEDISLK